jgi:4-alpha-glucanotransferase
MLAMEQIEDLAQSCRDKGLSFYLDLPVGVHSDSYDVWKNPSLYCLGLSAGAPPDSFFTKGQNWGFPPFRPLELEAHHFAHFRDVIRHHMSQASLLRLDHVMGLHRLYVVPQGLSADRGGYIRFPAEALYAVFLLEAARVGARMVGEDLGTVPDEVRESMTAHHLSRLFVFQYEASPAREGVIPHPASNTVASLNTHDMPMWASYWQGLDIPDRKDLGLLDDEGVIQERAARAQLNKKWVQTLESSGWLRPGASLQDIFKATMSSLARSEAELVLVTLEDAWLEERPQNTPGTHLERKNWQRKCRRSLEEITRDIELRHFLEHLTKLRE